jgi:hypothetical protein
VSVVIANSISTIKAWDLNGSRAQLEFAVLNDSDRLLAIRKLVLLVGPGATPDALYFKQFVEVKADARLPSDTRLPVIVPARSGRNLCAEFEGVFDVRLGLSDRECSLVVELNDRHIDARFTARGTPGIEPVLNELEQDAKERGSAVAFTLPISHGVT